MKKRGKLSIIGKGGSTIRSPPTSPILPLLETSLNLYNVDVSSSDEEDNSPWDERWVVDENEEEEKRLWAEKHKQKIAKSPKVEPRNQSASKQRRSKSDDDATPGSSNNKHEKPKSKRRASVEEDVPCYRISSDEMTNSEEIKTSEEEDTASERSSGPGQYQLLAASNLFLQPRSLSADDNLFALSRGRSLSLTEEVMRGYWNQNNPQSVTIQVSEEADKSSDLSTARQYHSSDSLRDDDSEEDKSKEIEKGKEKGSDEEKGSPISGRLYEDKRTEHLVKRSRSFSVENNASVYSPLAPRRRRALTPQRTPRPYMIKTPITIAGEQPPSGGPSGEEECLEWKPLWKAN